MSTTPDIYYDPYDFEIDTDPYPVWRRLRNESPLYYNERYDFWAISRFDDVERAFKDFKNLISGKGTILELVKADWTPPPGLFIFEDPPEHDIHRRLLSGVFTQRKMSAIEPQIRKFCAMALDPFVGSRGFDFIHDLGAPMPMRVIGMLLGIPEDEQEAIRARIESGLRLEEGADVSAQMREADAEQMAAFGVFVDWRTQHPTDDLMTELIMMEFEDEMGTTRRLNRDELLGYIGLLASAGNETTTKLIGWTGKVLSDHPEQLAELAADRSLIPAAIEEVLRYEAPSPVQARYVASDVEFDGQTVREGSTLLMLNGSANRDDRKFVDGDSFDIHRKIDHHLTFGYGLHFCIGAALARLEGRIALDEVLQRFPSWHVEADRAVQVRTSTVRGWDSLPVTTR